MRSSLVLAVWIAAACSTGRDAATTTEPEPVPTATEPEPVPTATEPEPVPTATEPEPEPAAAPEATDADAPSFGKALPRARLADLGDQGPPEGRRPRSPPPTILRLTDVEVKGALEPTVVRRIARRALPAQRRCYEERLLHRPELAGTMTIKLQVRPDGAVTAARSSGMDDRGLEHCFAEAARRLHFPAPTDGALAVVEVRVAVSVTPPPPPGPGVPR